MSDGAQDVGTNKKKRYQAMAGDKLECFFL